MRRITIVIAAIAGLAGIQAIAQTVDGLDLEAIKRRSAAMQGDADIFAEHVRNRGDAFREEAVAIQAKSSTNLTALAKADLPVNGDGAFDFDEIIKGASQNVAGTKGDAPQFIAFASLSMPPAALRQLIADTAKAGGVVVFRGFPNNSMKAFSAMLGKVVTDKDQLSNVGIDPRLFRAFNVEAVPTYVAVSTDFDLCSGLNCTRLGADARQDHRQRLGSLYARYLRRGARPRCRGGVRRIA
ncbi:type-F conjugative transfer system pilin assembly protein TrbC [Sphingomonas aurantiaca]|uniref:type-F conjugative transfer system pilin assembly protein TrbC n=1 Tax=Sphingomonas aurantiaca TaxID=185949 RepID=UPI002FE38B06